MGIKNFLRDSRGNVAMIFAFAAIPIAGMVGGAVDLQMATSERRQMQDALDAATLEVITREATGTRADREARLQRSYRANGGRGTVRMTRDMTTTASAVSIETSADQDLPTTILGVIGVDHFDIGVQAAAQRRPTLQSIRFRLRYISGAYSKNITLYGVRNGGTPVALMNIYYSWPVSTNSRSYTTISRLVNGRRTDASRV